MTRRTKSFNQLADYMLRGQKGNTIARNLIVRHNVKGNIQQCISAFEANEKNRQIKRHDAVRVYHEIISLEVHPSQVTEKMLEDLAQKYFELRAPYSMGIAIPHLNTEHPHIHAMISGVEIETGRATRISREAFAKVKEQIQEYERTKYPVLSQSSVEHGKKQKGIAKENEYQATNRTKAISERERIAQVVQSCYSKSLSKEDFLRHLSEAGLETYMRNGRLQGIESENRKYRFTTLGYEPNLKDLEVREAVSKDLEAFRAEREDAEKSQDIDKSDDLSDLLNDRFGTEATKDQTEIEDDTITELDNELDIDP